MAETKTHHVTHKEAQKTTCGRRVQRHYPQGQRSSAGPTRRSGNWEEVTCRRCLQLRTCYES